MPEPTPDELLRQELIKASNSTFGRSRKLIAVLGKIAAMRDSGFLYDILWMLWDKNAEVVYEACAVISVLLARITAVELPIFDAQLRVRWPMWGGMRSLDGEQLDRLKQSKTWWGSFALLASHGSGFVRQAAVEELARHETTEGLPFLLLRTSDWVEEVRNAARQVIAAKLKEISPSAWASCLPLVFRMRGMSRHQPLDLLESVEQVVAGQPDFLKANFAADHIPAFLRYRYGLAKAHTPISLEALIKSALEQKPLGVRLLACEWVLNEKNEERRRHFAQMLLRDKAPIVRARAFWKIASVSPDEFAGQIEIGLMDRSEAVQNVARGIWRLQLNQNALAYYQQRATTVKTSLEIIPVVRGLRAEGTLADESLVRPFLQNPLTKVQREAVKCLVVWDVADKGDLLIEGVQSKSYSYAKECAPLLVENPRFITTSLIQKLLASSGRYGARQIALRLTVKMSKWASLPLILHTYSIPACRKHAEAALRNWFRNFNRNQTSPSKQEVEDATREFALLANTPLGKHRDLAAIISSLK